jgi:hypothetical protein
MPRTLLVVMTLAGSLFRLLGLRHVVADLSRQAAPAAAAGFVGSWRVTVFEVDGPPTLALMTLGADGTLVSAEHPVVTPPMAPGVVFASGGHGAWRASGPETAVLTSIGLGSLGDGTLLGVVTMRASLTLATDRQALVGEFVATIDDRDGTTVGTFPGTLEGRRILAEAPATAAPGTED